MKVQKLVPVGLISHITRRRRSKPLFLHVPI
jgi:hypothetical protein